MHRKNRLKYLIVCLFTLFFAKHIEAQELKINKETAQNVLESLKKSGQISEKDFSDAQKQLKSMNQAEFQALTDQAAKELDANSELAQKAKIMMKEAKIPEAK